MNNITNNTLNYIFDTLRLIMKRIDIFEQYIDDFLFVNIKLLSENAKIPSYAHNGDAGLDLYSSCEQIVEPNSRKMIKTGISLEIPVGYEACVRPRSGLAIHKGLTVLNSPGTIDSNYRGEICVILYNTSNVPFHINVGDRIAQLVFQKIPMVKFMVVNDINETERNDNGFGSSGI